MTTLTAQMTGDGGPWRLYVVRYGQATWPTFRWAQSAPVPAVAQRRAALELLGYQIVPGARWEWTEDTRDPDDDSTTPVLIAATLVRVLGGAS